MNEKSVVLITGMSGAGKTTAIGVLEDMGYYCIDNFPVQLLSALDDVITKDQDLRFNHVALATTAIDYPKFLNYFENMDMKVKVVFLDAKNDVLLARYRLTRRQHPMILLEKATTLEDAIEVEREMFDRLNENQLIRIDTTKMSGKKLKESLLGKLALEKTEEFVVTLTSFGFKYGIPLDIDMILDVRFLPNPYYIDELKDLTGDDKAVYDFVINHPKTQEYIKEMKRFLDYTLAQYKEENKAHLTIGIGCTGGQHRSVSLVNWLFTHYQKEYSCHKSHRDQHSRGFEGEKI